MSDSLFEACLDFALDDNTTLTSDEIMVRYWDEVSEQVLTMSQTYNLTPQHVIEEFCVDSDFPDDPNQPSVDKQLTDLYHERVNEEGDLN